MMEGFLLTQLQLNVFLYALERKYKFNGDEWECGGSEFLYARKILESMGISPIDQEKLLEICKENGGCCDCKILMNAARFLTGEGTTE